MQTITIEYKKDYAIIQLNRGKVNAIELEMVRELRKAFKDLEANESVRGVILSGKPHYFSAGLDLVELYDYDEAKISSFWKEFLNLSTEMTKFSKPFVCAITGHSPAGGCVLAITADYRVMTEGEKYKIGLNEVAVGIQLSPTIAALYAFWLGHRKASQYLLIGKMHSPQEALECGLVDQITNLEDVLPAAEKQLQKYLNAKTTVFKSAKLSIRKELIKQVDIDTNSVAEVNSAYWWSPESRMMLQMFIENLKRKKTATA